MKSLAIIVLSFLLLISVVGHYEMLKVLNDNEERNLEHYNDLVTSYNKLVNESNNRTSQYYDLDYDYRVLNSTCDSLEEHEEITARLRRFSWTGCSDDAQLMSGTTKCTGSMKPMIDCDNTIYMCYADDQDLHVGDIVTFVDKDSNHTILHRIIKITPQGYLMRGDANYVSDGLIQREDIILKLDSVEG